MALYQDLPIFVDRTGKIVINPQFDEASGFVWGRARVRFGTLESGKHGFIS